MAYYGPNPIFPGTVTGTTGVNATTGNIEVILGNLTLPATDILGNGNIAFNGATLINNFAGNIFIGQPSGNTTLDTGSSVANVSVGSSTLQSLTEGDHNIAIGQGVLNSLTTGIGNTSIGGASLATTDTGEFNTAVGYAALNGLGTGGNFNIALGYNAAQGYFSNESSNIMIGSGGVTGESNVIRIGTQGASDGEQNTCFIAGIFGSTVDVATGVAAFVDVNGQLGTVVSSERFKENIEDMDNSSNFIMSLRPVIFNYKSDQNKNIEFGLIAEEVNEICPELVALDQEGIPYTVKYHALPALLLNELQKQAEEIEELKRKIELLAGV